ncbi:hypothetical protein JB92DRAFT_2975140 [Gautieria morchelliformis]|nr:hypothetical protein JB92DRAFT_2975140 [Gautieria morchelliformis]
MSMATTDAPSVAESSTARHSTLNGGPGLGGPSKVVATSPPWAKDEPESPLSDSCLPGPDHSLRLSGTSTTHVASVISEHPSAFPGNLNGHNRWKFALPRPRPKMKRGQSTDPAASQSDIESPIPEKRHRPGSSRPRWSSSRKRTLSLALQNSEVETTAGSLSRTPGSESLRLELPLPLPTRSLLQSYDKTPGWDSPWTPRIPERVHVTGRDAGREPDQGADNNDAAPTTDSSILDLEALNPWHRRKRNLRSFLLNNTYVPLFSRIANITFTIVTLVLAVRIRVIEQENHVRGVVGSSPVLAIIFAPLTLVHVMIAIYLEYFGRPLGLWRTSAKLAHTLSEVVFICAWSAELALCFDNYFTSSLNCAPRSTVQWYSELPPPANPLGNNVTSDRGLDARALCASQVDLTGVVMVALLLYVTNLVISLFRIFEKVKIRQGWGHKR